MVDHGAEPGGVAIYGEPLVGVVEVAVVEGVAHRQAGDVAGGEFLRVGLPLFGGVVAHESLVEGAAD